MIAGSLFVFFQCHTEIVVNVCWDVVWFVILKVCDCWTVIWCLIQWLSSPRGSSRDLADLWGSGCIRSWHRGYVTRFTVAVSGSDTRGRQTQTGHDQPSLHFGTLGGQWPNFYGLLRLHFVRTLRQIYWQAGPWVLVVQNTICDVVLLQHGDISGAFCYLIVLQIHCCYERPFLSLWCQWENQCFMVI